VPDAPAKPIISEVTTNRCVMSWFAPPGYNEEITAYFIEYRIGHRGDYGSTKSVSGYDRRAKIGDLLPGTAYQFRIRAMNRMGRGPWSDASAQVITDFGVPQKLRRPEIVNISTSSIIISWWAPVPTVKGSAIHEFEVQTSGNGSDFDHGEKMEVSWIKSKQNFKDWEKRKAKIDELAKEGKDEDDVVKKKGLKGGVSKMMMALRSKRDSKAESRKSRKSVQMGNQMMDVLNEVNAEAEADLMALEMEKINSEAQRNEEQRVEKEKRQAKAKEKEKGKRKTMERVGEGNEAEGETEGETPEGEGEGEGEGRKMKRKKKKRKKEKGKRKNTEFVGMVGGGEIVVVEKQEKEIEPPPKASYQDASSNRKKAFMAKEIERTRKHLEDRTLQRKKKAEAKRNRASGRTKQKRLEKKSKLVVVETAEEKQLKKLFTRMSYTVENLQPGIMYRIRIGAVNNTGLGPFSDASFSTFTSR